MIDKRNLRSFIVFLFAAAILMIFLKFFYSLWSPGKDITDGRHDLKRNGIWIQHGWLGDDMWFIKNQRKDKILYFRNPEQIQKLATLFQQHNISDIYPHLCPTSMSGEIAGVDLEQTKLFLKTFKNFRVMPWVGGVLGVQAFPEKAEWRRNFADSIRMLLIMHPEFAGIHINIEPCPNDYKEFLTLLEDVRKVMPKGKILSVAAFPPPTLLHPFKDVHWDKDYYHQIAKRSDQIVVMMYNTAIRFEKIYQNLISNWTREVLKWSGDTEVLLGLPAYEDKGVGYHDPSVENLKNSLHGIHAGLNRYNILPKNYQGIALYCEWEMNVEKWHIFENYFQKKK